MKRTATALMAAAALVVAGITAEAGHRGGCGGGYSGCGVASSCGYGGYSHCGYGGGYSSCGYGGGFSSCGYGGGCGSGYYSSSYHGGRWGGSCYGGSCTTGSWGGGCSGGNCPLPGSGGQAHSSWGDGYVIHRSQPTTVFVSRTAAGGSVQTVVPATARMNEFPVIFASQSKTSELKWY